MNLKNKERAIFNYIKAMKILREEQILLNKKDFTGQIGEWLVEQIYEGKRSNNGIQKGWDILIGNLKIQVKTHSKAISNKAKFTQLNLDTCTEADEIIIIVFTEDYKLRAFYKFPICIAIKHSKVRGKKRPKTEINWSSLEEFRIEPSKLPKQEIIGLFS